LFYQKILKITKPVNLGVLFKTWGKIYLQYGLAAKVLLCILFVILSGCENSNMSNEEEYLATQDRPDPVKITIFYILVFLNISFLIFVLLSRYLTRNNKHDEESDID